MLERRGIVAAGNWIIDHVKIIDRLPAEEYLAEILSETRGTGGSPYNVLVGLRALDASLPLSGIGIVGDDEAGNFILNHLRRLNIAIDGMRQAEGVATSYTDVMTVKETGHRTFFHNRGANSLLGPAEFDFAKSTERILHLGYLMLLDGLDAPDPNDPSRPCAALVLERARTAGISTSLDIVTNESQRIHEIVRPTLPLVDYFIANELESAALTDTIARDSMGTLVRANLPVIARRLFEIGVNKLVVIHAPEGAFWRDSGGEEFFLPSLDIPEGWIEGTAGAGDAFCGGILYGIHENWNADNCLRLATAHAAQSLSDSTTTGGLKSLNETLGLLERFNFRIC